MYLAVGIALFISKYLCMCINDGLVFVGFNNHLFLLFTNTLEFETGSLEVSEHIYTNDFDVYGVMKISSSVVFVA